METLKKYWWLILLLPVVLYMIYIMMKETKENKPGSPEYARSFRWPGKKKAEQEEEVKPSDNGSDIGEPKTV
jgi:hypothetical protein